MNSLEEVQTLFKLFEQADLSIDRIYAISSSKQTRRVFRNLKPLDVRRMLGPVDFATAKQHEALLKQLLNHHPNLKLPAQITAAKVSDRIEYHKYQLLRFLGLVTEQEEGTPSPNMNEHFPLLPHLNLSTVRTEDLQRYIDLESTYVVGI